MKNQHSPRIYEAEIFGISAYKCAQQNNYHANDAEPHTLARTTITSRQT